MKVKPGYKQTGVGVIPEDWEVKPLKRISPRQSVGLVINPSTYFDKVGTVPLLVGSNVSENVIDSTTANRITKASNELLPASRLVAGDLVTVRVGEPGITAVVPPELNGCNCASMMIVRQHPSFDSHWLCWMMNSKHGRRQVGHVQYGTAQKQFNISHAVDFLYPVPPLPEQRAIATALGDVDGLLGGLDRLIAKKRDLKQAAMQQLLTGQTRLPGFHGEWEVKRLGDICGRITTGKLDANAMVADGDYPFFTCARENCWIDKYAFDYEALLVSGNGANVGYVHYYNGKFNAYQRTYVISEFTADVQFIKAFLVRNIQERIRVEVNAGNTPYITMGTLTEMEINLPPFIPEQTAIAEVLTEMDGELAALTQRRDKTRALKQAMMQELLTGRTRLIPKSTTEVKP